MSLRHLVVPVLATSLLTGTLAVGSATSAAAEPSWTPPRQITARAELVKIEVGGRGDIYSTFMSSGGRGSYTRDRQGSWNPWSQTAPGGAYVGAVVDRRGNTTVAYTVDGRCDDWYEESPKYEDFSVEVAYRPRGGTWREQRIRGHWDGCSGSIPELAADENGTVTAVWTGDDRVFAALRPRGGHWTDPVAVGPFDGTNSFEGKTFDVLAGRDGRTVVVWLAKEGVMSATSRRPGRWTEPRRLAPSYGMFQGPWDLRLAGDDDGNVVAAWFENAGTLKEPVFRVRSVARPAGGRWERPQTVATQTGPQRVKEIDLAVDEAAATLVWYQGNADDNAGSVRVASRPRGQWGRPRVLARIGTWTRPSVAANELGTMAVWSQGPHGSISHMAAYRRPGGGWSTARRLARPVEGPRGEQSSRAPVVVAARPDMFTAILKRGVASGYVDFAEDTTAPSARVTSPRRHVVYPEAPVSWAAADDLTGFRDFDVRVRSAGRDARFSRWSRWLTNTRTMQQARDFRPGRTYCFQARATDGAGNQGRWGRHRCVSTPVDDRAAKASAGWSRVEDESAFGGTLTRTRRRGQRLRLPDVAARQIGVVARTCPDCGAVRVWHAGRRLGTVDLSTAQEEVRRVFLLGRSPRRLTGRVVIRVVSSGKPVHVDGIIARR